MAREDEKGWSWGGAGGGAATGFGTGMMVGGPIGAGIGTMIGGIGGGLFGGRGKPAQGREAKWLQNPQWSFTEPRMRLMSDWASGALQNINEGKIPWYIQKMGDLFRETAQPGALAQQ